MRVLQTREIERMERKLVAAMGARERDTLAAIEALEEAIAFARSSPEAADWFVPAELLADLADEYAAAGRPDDALAAMGQAIAEGWTSEGDPRCRLAEIQLSAGRSAEAERIWSQVRREKPDDVWLFNHAGVANTVVGEWAAGLRWLTDGLELALRTGDPDELVEQLQECREECLVALGRELDELHEEAELFLRTGGGVRAGAVGAPVSTYAAPAGPLAVRWAWFPAGEYERALREFPDLVSDGGPAVGRCDHVTYCRRTQLRLREGAGALMTRVAVAPIRVDAYLSWCARLGEDPQSARATYAATLDPAELVAWPPGRNDACWCGSGRRYKRCCASSDH